MNIILKLAPKTNGMAMAVDAGSKVEDILWLVREQLPYRVYAARINNHVVPLNTVVPDGAEVVLLDMRDPEGKEAYQNSVLRLYIASVKAEIPGADIVISSSLNRGIFTFINNAGEITQELADAVEKRMRNLSKNPVPFTEIYDGPDLVVPTTGFIRNFDLRLCRGGIVVRIPEDTHPQGLAPYRDDVKIYDAFAAESQWADKLGIKCFSDLNKVIEEGCIDDIIRVSEALHEKNVAEIADQIVKSGKRIVLIAGPSSSGKTSFAKRLCTQLWVAGTKPIYLGTDDYYMDRDKIPFGPDGKQNFENLDSIDVELFNKQMNALLNGEEVDIPRFDFQTGKQVFGERFEKLDPGQPVVIEGIHGLNDAMTPSIDASDKFKIYISPLTQIRIDDYHRVPLTDVRKLRRIIRDAAKRNWSAKQTIDAWPAVRAGEDVNIFPYSSSADALFNSTQVYELAVIKKYARPLLEESPEDDEDYCEAQRLLRLLACVDEVDDDHCVANNSILREFIGGSTIV